MKNAHGLPTKIMFAVGTADEAFVQMEYDAADNLTAEIDELGRRTEYAYDLDSPAQRQSKTRKRLQKRAPTPTPRYSVAVSSVQEGLGWPMTARVLLAAQPEAPKGGSANRRWQV